MINLLTVVTAEAQPHTSNRPHLICMIRGITKDGNKGTQDLVNSFFVIWDVAMMMQSSGEPYNHSV